MLEVGAETGLAGIVTALARAEQTMISDYPAAELLSDITKNVEKNVPEDKRSQVSYKVVSGA